METTKQNRLLLIETIAGTFPKITRDRLPQWISGPRLAMVWPEIFNQRTGYLISKATLAKKFSMNKERALVDEENALIATALWWAVTSNANPYKIEVHTMMFWDNCQRQAFEAIDKILTPLAPYLAHLEKDRAKLSAMGAY
jgi:hypothetical protein